MNILAIDTTSPRLTVALTNGRRVWKRSSESRSGHDDLLMRQARALLSSAKMELSDVDLFAAVRGPGSFTGVRVGMTFVSVLAGTLGKEARGVTLFEIEAWRASHSKQCKQDQRIGVVLPARKGEFFFQMFRSSPGGKPEPEAEPASVSPERWPAFFRETGAGSGILLTGDAAADAREALGAEKTGVELLSEGPFGAEDLLGAVRDARPGDFSPLYLTPAYYERAAS